MGGLIIIAHKVELINVEWCLTFYITLLSAMAYTATIKYSILPWLYHGLSTCQHCIATADAVLSSIIVPLTV